MEKDVWCHLTSWNDIGLGWPHSSKRGFLGPMVKAMYFLGGSGYAKRSTKMALAVVWPKMKAPRVTKRTP